MGRSGREAGYRGRQEKNYLLFWVNASLPIIRLLQQDIFVPWATETVLNEKSRHTTLKFLKLAAVLGVSEELP